MVALQIESNGLPRSRWFSYPHGERPILSLFLTIMAVFASFMAFSYFNGGHPFLCIEYDANLSTNHECIYLQLSNEKYWDDEQTDGWANAIVVASIAGIFASVLGLLSVIILLTATCFAVDPKRVRNVIIMLSVASLLQVATFVAGAADVCKGLTNCEVKSAHFDVGASFALCSFLLYLASLPLAIGYMRFARNSTHFEPIPTAAVGPDAATDRPGAYAPSPSSSLHGP